MRRDWLTRRVLALCSRRLFLALRLGLSAAAGSACLSVWRGRDGKEREEAEQRGRTQRAAHSDERGSLTLLKQNVFRLAFVR